MAKIEILRKFIKARDHFGEAITKSGQQYIKTIDPDANEDDANAEFVEDEAEAMEKGIDGIAPRVIKALKYYEHQNFELEQFAKEASRVKVAKGEVPPPTPEADTSHFKDASKDARKWLAAISRTIHEDVLKSDLATADSAGRFSRAGKEFLEACNELTQELNKHTATILKTAAKDATPPDLPPSDFQGEFRKILKAGKLDPDTESFVREIKEVDSRFKKLDGNRVYTKFQDLCKPALAALKELTVELQKFDPKKSKNKNDDDDDLDPKKLAVVAKELIAFAKRVDEYDDRIFLFSRL